jgi:hypothetical protein
MGIIFRPRVKLESMIPVSEIPKNIKAHKLTVLDVAYYFTLVANCNI